LRLYSKLVTELFHVPSGTSIVLLLRGRRSRWLSQV
jgi:hypothetical protein